MLLVLLMLFINISVVNASDIHNTTISSSDSVEEKFYISNENIVEFSESYVNSSSELMDKLTDDGNNEEILIEPGTYRLHNITITKNITLQGNGNPRDIIIDAERQSSIFLIRNDAVHVTFKNITFINADVVGFGGAISMETGHVYVDNCIFANNTASVNAGGISNYGNADNKGYLLVNNSLFINNHADHDGGAVTTCYANSDIYNCVFINNSAHRDGGAIRVSVQGYGNVQDCIFMYNHADEWGGAYYSWSGTSNIERCIFLNNTAGTNGGAVMVSGDINIENSIIVNNSGGETGGSFYIQQPMYDARTVINVHDNLITNNTSPYGQEIYIYWNDTRHLYTKFNDNDWGDEDPNDPSVIDPRNVTPRSKVTSTKKSNLLNTLSMDLLLRYGDLIGGYFPDGYLDKIEKEGNNNENNPIDNVSTDGQNSKTNTTNDNPNIVNREDGKTQQNAMNPTTSSNIIGNNQINANNTMFENGDENNEIAIGNSTSVGAENKAYELNKSESAVKTVTPHINYYIFIFLLIALIALIFGYKREKAKNK